jgi:hypothetical protein
LGLPLDIGQQIQYFVTKSSLRSSAVGVRTYNGKPEMACILSDLLSLLLKIDSFKNVTAGLLPAAITASSKMLLLKWKFPI